MFSRLVAIAAWAALRGYCGDWSPQLAADYLDSRQKEWFAWPAAKAPGGPCVSCHTGLTYLLARPVLTAENRTSQKVGESRVTRDARAARGLGRRPGKPFLLSRIEIVRGELRGPVSAVSTKSGPSGNGNETRKHMALLLRGRRGV